MGIVLRGVPEVGQWDQKTLEGFAKAAEGELLRRQEMRARAVQHMMKQHGEVANQVVGSSLKSLSDLEADIADGIDTREGPYVTNHTEDYKLNLKDGTAEYWRVEMSFSKRLPF